MRETKTIASHTYTVLPPVVAAAAANYPLDQLAFPLPPPRQREATMIEEQPFNLYMNAIAVQYTPPLQYK